jgi:hypothetical protein
MRRKDYITEETSAVMHMDDIIRVALGASAGESVDWGSTKDVSILYQFIKLQPIDVVSQVPVVQEFFKYLTTTTFSNIRNTTITEVYRNIAYNQGTDKANQYILPYIFQIEKPERLTNVLALVHGYGEAFPDVAWEFIIEKDIAVEFLTEAQNYRRMTFEFFTDMPLSFMLAAPKPAQRIILELYGKAASNPASYGSGAWDEKFNREQEELDTKIEQLQAAYNEEPNEA